MFDNELAHVYYVEWNTSSGYHRMLITTDTPLRPSRLNDFKKEYKSVRYELKRPQETLETVVARIRNDDGAFG